MNLEQMQAPIDGIDQADAPGQEMHGPDAAMSQAAHSVSDLIMNVAGREHGSLQIGHDRFVQTPFDATLAVGEFSPYDLVHSKSLLASDVEVCDYSSDARKRRGILSFFKKSFRRTPAGSLVQGLEVEEFAKLLIAHVRDRAIIA